MWLEGKGPSGAPTAVEPAPSVEPEVQIAPEAVVMPVSAETTVESAALEQEVPPQIPEIPSADAFFDTEAKPETVQAPPPELKVVADTKAAPNEKKVKVASTDQKQNGAREDEIIRVNLSRIDMLNDYVGELIVLQSVIQQQTSVVASSTLQTSVRQMVKLSKDIQSLSMSLRMLPVKPLVQKLQRVVRDTAKALNKEVSFEIAGEQIDIDKSVLDRLADPLIHILRNAVDHGLETTDARIAAKKNPEGNVKLSFSNDGNHLVVEVTDDGKGINAEVIRKKAIEKHVISDKQTLTEKQLVNLIFHAGFSTKTETSEISGRGVGMDVVKTNVEKIGGSVDITTKVGHGSTFRLQIPLSLAVIEGLVVTSDTNRYVVPLNQVQETINLKTQKIFTSKLGIGMCFELRGVVVPVVGVEEVLGNKKATPDQSNTALIINVRDQLVALAVKDVIRAQQIVIKPLGNGIRSQKGWIGSCVLGDGLPTLILSPFDLLDGKISQSIIDQTISGVA